jgi:integrase
LGGHWETFSPEPVPIFSGEQKKGAIMSTIRLEIRKDKKDSKGAAPIRLVYQIHGDRSYYNTKSKVDPDYWNEGDQVAIYKKKGKYLDSDIEKINSDLSELLRKIKKIEQRFDLDGRLYESSMVIAELKSNVKPKTKKSEASRFLYDFIDQYISDHSSTRVKGSLSVYRSLKMHLEGFEKEKKAKISFDKIDHSFFQAFQNYLHGLRQRDRDGSLVKDDDGTVRRKLNNVTVAKQLSTLKTFLTYAREKGIVVPQTFFRVKRENDLEIIALTEREYETLFNLDLSGRPAWDQVRDVFCFSCCTGLRYSDLKQLRREHIQGNEIDLRTIKTSHKIKIPLIPDALAILKKYKDESLPLPLISNQKSNEHLGNICKFAGIDSPIEIVRHYGNQRIAKFYPKYELVRMHCGRKTFATISIAKGMRAEIVMKLGTWKDWKSFKRYAEISDQTARQAMELAYRAKPKSKLKAV